MEKRKGRITIPTDANYVEGTKVIADLWGADAVRDCDGTSLPKCAKEIAEKVYNTYFCVRGDNEWADAHLDELQNVALISDRKTATDTTLVIDLLDGYSDEQLKVNPNDYRKYFQVFDRTTGELHTDYDYDGDRTVTIKNAKKFHEYTVNFFAYNMWDGTQMYNYITNNWNIEKHKVFDPRYPASLQHIKDKIKEWMKNSPEVNVVRFTTFLYHFTIIFNNKRKEKRVDWFGYAMTASPKAFEDFEKQYGYEITLEDIVDKGYFHTPFSNPSKKYKDYMEYTEKYVTSTVRQLTDIVHEGGMEAMMFLGDSWIGTEPYGEHFKDMNLDAVVGSVGGGVTVRMLSDIPHVKYREGRFLPYFFPDTFFDGNEGPAVDELNRNWLTARRAMMRKPLDRIGYGGYLQLAAKFPKFIQRGAEICDEFRTIYDALDGKKPYSTLKVGVLNAWGKKRSWMSHMVAHELWYQQIYSYQGLLESLSGLPVDVEFISFDDIKNGVPADIDVIANVGDAYTAFSGGENWLDEKVTTAIREFVYNGGGFIGIGEPSAIQHGGRYFQLSDVLGVDKELGFTLSEDKHNIEKVEHEITKGFGEIDYGEGMKNVYALPGTKVLDIEFSDRFKRSFNVGEVKMAVNEYGKGRSFYITGLPYSFKNAKLLYKAMVWSCGKDLNKAYSTNEATDCNYYPASGKYAIVNNSKDVQVTTFYDIDGNAKELTLQPMEILWIKK